MTRLDDALRKSEGWRATRLAGGCDELFDIGRHRMLGIVGDHQARSGRVWIHDQRDPRACANAAEYLDQGRQEGVHVGPSVVAGRARAGRHRVELEQVDTP